MSALTARNFSTVRINLRAEARRALLAAGESCWVYALLLVIARIANFPNVISPFGIFFSYWLALQVGRILPRQPRAWRQLQSATVLIAALVVVLALRLDLYRDVPLFDLTAWLMLLGQLFNIFKQFTPEQLSALALLYAYWRGLGFAHRPLTLWFVAFQFRLGVLIFFLASIFSAFVGGIDFRVWVFVYFIISLLGISLARIEEGGREMALGGKWVLVLVGAVVAAVTLGLALTRLFTLGVAAAFFGMLWPLALLFEILVTLIIIPLSFVVDFLAHLLEPVFRALSEVITRLFSQLPQVPPPTQQTLDAVNDQIAALVPYFRLVGLIALVFIIALVIARTLHRRMLQIEEETFIREASDTRDFLKAEKITRTRSTAVKPREIEAENIRRIYAALLARAQSLDLPRRAAETPLEFLPRLSARFPAASNDLRALTEAYVAVHYAQQNATTAQVREMRAVWTRLRAELIEDKQNRQER